jgi:glycosyltransferase involved in cell wall biosynthesis
VQKFGADIRYVHKPNGGQASAFNCGSEHARGEVIAFLDADDVWLPEKLGRIYEEFKRNPTAGMVYNRTYLWKGGEETSEDTYFIEVSGNVPESRRALLQYPMIGTSCLSFRRNALKKLLPVPEALRSQADAYLTALIIFLTPVVAVPEFLGKYRLHGANLYQVNAEGSSRSQVEHRIAMRAELLSSIQEWLGKHGHEVGAADIRAYLKQWTKAQERDGFALDVPGRWKYFQHLVEFPEIYGEIMTWRHRANSYLRAFAALFLGYHHLHLLDDIRMKRKQKLSPSAAKSTEAEKQKALAVKG